jgi:hypothetical protein
VGGAGSAKRGSPCYAAAAKLEARGILKEPASCLRRNAVDARADEIDHYKAVAR